MVLVGFCYRGTTSCQRWKPYFSVDVDEDQEKWKDMVAEKELEGIHIRDPSEEVHSVWQVYHLSGIPRYILVDQHGMLVSAEAPRPSSSTIKDEIQGLLKNTSTL